MQTTIENIISSKKVDFSLPEHVSYLNCAYMGPQLKSVESAGVAGLKRKNLPYEVTPEDFFSQVIEVKKAFAKIINAPDYERIAIIPSVSYGINTVVKNIAVEKGQNIILAAEQFPSNYYPWQKCVSQKGAELKLIQAPESNQKRGKIWNENILNAIDKNTAAVSIGHVHWADGTLFDLQKIRKRTSDVGAALIIDGSQSVGALPFDVETLQVDALVNVGYKWLLGPYGMAMAYYGPMFDGGEPIEENWINRKNSEDFKNLVDYESEYKPKANRYMVGQNSRFIHTPMQLAAMTQILEWGVESIQEYCKTLTAGPVEVLREIGCFIEEDSYRSHHLFGIRTNGLFNMEKLKHLLAENHVYVSFRGDAIRVSPNVYNEPKDFTKLIDCFKMAMV